VNDLKKENQNLKDKMAGISKVNSQLQEKVDLLENNLQSSIEQINILEKKLDEAISMHDDLEQYSRNLVWKYMECPNRKGKIQKKLCLTWTNASTST